MRKAVWIGAALMLAAGFAAWQTTDARADSHEVEPLVSGYELMEIFYEPFMEHLKESVAAEPDKRRGWQDIYKRSLALGEASTLNLMRNDQDYMSTPEWKEMTLANRALTVEISEAAKEQDFAGVTAKYQALVKSCNECHTKFEPDTAPTIEP